MEMTNQFDLVLDIVLSDDKAFKCDLSKEQILNLMLCNKEVLTYPNIWRMYCKHYAYYLYNKLHEIIKMFIKNRNEEEKEREEFENKKNEILREIWEESDDILWDCFERLIIAEYKEYVYNCNSKYYRYFGADYYDEMCEYVEFINMFDIQNHIHDPIHFMFNNNPRIYYFYENSEKNGDYVLY